MRAADGLGRRRRCDDGRGGVGVHGLNRSDRVGHRRIGGDVDFRRRHEGRRRLRQIWRRRRRRLLVSFGLTTSAFNSSGSFWMRPDASPTTSAQIRPTCRTPTPMRMPVRRAGIGGFGWGRVL